jgi:hypothetical protein
MSKSVILRRASAAALLVALGASAASAQQSLPTIQVGDARPAAGPATRAPAPAPARLQPAPPPRIAAAPAAAPAKPEPTVTSATTRSFTNEQINDIPFAQPSQALNIVPGLVVESHTGAGKAFHYYMRGFDLDHGNDLSLTLDGMPLNMPSHAHGQGYADANFIIPELFSSVDVRKGPFFADEGVFASAGAIHMQYFDQLRQGLLSASGGSFAYGRLLGAKSWALGDGELLAAIEGNIYNGPWERPDEARKVNGVVRWSQGTQDNGLSVTAMAYSNHWFATEEVPQHMVDQGFLSRWGTLDPTDGGNAARYSLSARWSEKDQNSFSRVEGFVIRNTLNLYNDYTGYTTFLDSGSLLGDQAHQFDRRTIYGLNATHGFNYSFANLPIETRIGFQGRYDDIRNGLQDSFERQAVDTISDDYVKEGSLSLWSDTTVHWAPWLRTTVGGRFDFFSVDVNALQNPTLAAPAAFDVAGNFIGSTAMLNSGSRSMTMGSPKGGIVLGPFYQTEFYANFGEGLQSTDARGTVLNVNPANGTPFSDSGVLTQAPLLVKTRGAEVGAKTHALAPGLETGIAFYWQDFDSENLYEGDSGTTVFGRPSRRYGLEWTAHYEPVSWARFDADLTASRARFRGNDLPTTAAYLGAVGDGTDPVAIALAHGTAPGNYLPLAPTIIATAGVELGEKTGWFGTLRYRYFGARPLTEDGAFWSHASNQLNGRVGYRFDNGWKVQVDGFNLTNSRSEALSFAYPSLTRSDILVWGLTNTVMSRHFKPQDPFAVRLTVAGPLTLFDPGVATVAAKY